MLEGRAHTDGAIDGSWLSDNRVSIDNATWPDERSAESLAGLANERLHATNIAPDLSIGLRASAPFNLEATVRLLQRRPANRVDRWENGAYLRAVSTPQGIRLLRITNQGTIQDPSLRLDVFGGETSSESAAMAESTARWVLGLEAPPAPVSWLQDVEPKLGRIAESLLGFRTPCFPSLFETVASVLPFQQLSLDAGVAIVGRLVERFGESRAIDGHMRFSFPTPEAITAASSSALREIGLSGAKASSLRKLARLTVDGQLDAGQLRSLPTPEAMTALGELPGIGSWSAGLILLRGLRRLDVFPEGDVGAARNLTALIQPATPFTPASASTFAARFGDQRGYLYFLALGDQLLTRGLLGTAQTF